MEVVALIALAVVVLDPGLLRGILTPRRAATGAAGQPGPSPAGGVGTNTYNGGPGPVAAGGSPPPTQQPANNGGWMGLVGVGAGLVNGILGAVGMSSNNGSGSPSGSQLDQFDTVSRGGQTSTGATDGDTSWTNNNSDPATQPQEDQSYWGDNEPISGPPSYGAGSDGAGTADDGGLMDYSGGF